jgi:hypothetical protein
MRTIFMKVAIIIVCMKQTFSVYTCSKSIDQSTCASGNINNTVNIYGNIDGFYTCPFNTNYFCDNLWNDLWGNNTAFNSICVAKLSVGAHCNIGYQCQTHLCVNQVCISQIPNNGVCVSSLQCGSYSYCSNSSTCIQRLGDSKPCNYSWQCSLISQCLLYAFLCFQLMTTNQILIVIG